ncbi:MAG: hypothetical protein P4L74_02145 [Candidatus Doudnabacteria bacterium]|nr:hypothetical protein [Candidatus Doudnabacteria bacterium]
MPLKNEGIRSPEEQKADKIRAALRREDMNLRSCTPEVQEFLEAHPPAKANAATK